MQFDQLKRRELIALLGGAAAWPKAVRAQQTERVRRIGVLTSLATDDPEDQARLSAFTQGLHKFGWIVGDSVRIDVRFGAGDTERISKFASELVSLKPDLILAYASPSVVPLLRATRTIPIVFANVIDPVGAGFVASLARPGGNATGFSLFEYGISVKWLELLKQIAPGVTRVAVLRDASSPTGIGLWAVMQASASSFAIDLSPIDTSDPGVIESNVRTFRDHGHGGLAVVPGTGSINHRKLIFALAFQYRLPSIYPLRFFAAEEGLISYGPNSIDQSRQAADYVNRILRGEKPANLPVQNPTKYELIINLKTAKALDLTVPPSLLARADEVIE
jgi:putative ABC transport system substrate-binding protein